jgi:hypothetical protein
LIEQLKAPNKKKFSNRSRRRAATTTMNFFGGGQQQPQGPDPVVAAKMEMEVYTGSFFARSPANLHPPWPDRIVYDCLIRILVLLT